MLALDLDGTTLLDSKEISENNRQWIRKAVDEGVVVSIATGRGIQGAENYRAELGLTSPMILLNGGEIWKAPGELLERHFMNEEHIYQLHQIAMKTDSWFWGFTLEGMKKKSEWTDDLLKQTWMKFGILNEDTTILTEIRVSIKDWDGIEITSSAPNNLEVSPKGISKEYGVSKICEFLGFSLNDVMAIGDSLNDFKLIQAAGLGIAMGNAEDKLKQVADEITDTNEQDGVAKAISKYLL